MGALQVHGVAVTVSSRARSSARMASHTARKTFDTRTQKRVDSRRLSWAFVAAQVWTAALFDGFGSGLYQTGVTARSLQHRHTKQPSRAADLNAVRVTDEHSGARR